MRILVSAEHVVVRQGLRQVISATPDITVAAEAKNAGETLEHIRGGGFELLLLDISLSGIRGVELIRRVRSEAPHIPVLVLSLQSDLQVAARAVRAGATGCLTREGDTEVLLGAIREVGRGRNFIDHALATRMVFQTGGPGECQPTEVLSDREYQVFVSLVKGRTLVDIAEELHLSAKTISTHKFRIMRKLGLSSMSELIRYAIKQGVA